MNTTTWGTGRSFTMDDLLAAMERLADIPPSPFYASSKFFPTDKALSFKRDGRDYLGAHPDVWAKIPTGDLGTINPAWRDPIYNIDIDEKHRAEFFDAMGRALI